MSDPEQPSFQPSFEPSEKNPFWGYNELLVFLGLAPVCLIVGFALVRLPLRLLNIHPAAQAVELIPGQTLGYFLLFAALAVVFRQWYGRPFWASLGWT